MATRKDTSPRVEVASDLDVLLSNEEAARFLGVAPDTLERWRRQGRGPTFVRMSKTLVGYRKRRLLEFIEQREFQSTAAESASTASSEGEGKNFDPTTLASLRP